ncbi:hypothetical protein CEXT_76541 [Caerostris extrusa]|uniref:Uncharacterized protein n=1 Tax=Caerostris extrusa TaxID=172846 RepID=A0AAV4M588_CAEEX|nr:hypothetical protein CEXT_76541 [Caerostris extrusa]
MNSGRILTNKNSDFQIFLLRNKRGLQRCHGNPFLSMIIMALLFRSSPVARFRKTDRITKTSSSSSSYYARKLFRNLLRPT